MQEVDQEVLEIGPRTALHWPPGFPFCGDGQEGVRHGKDDGRDEKDGHGYEYVRPGRHGRARGDGRGLWR
mgnify:CR=1 FL=1